MFNRFLHIFFFSFLGFLAFNVKAQETKKVIKTQEGTNVKEAYYVLISDKNIKEGKYARYYSGINLPVETGFFKNDLKDSTWVVYFPGSEHFLSKGNFKNGKKEGIWMERIYNNGSIYLAEKGVYKNGERVGTWQFFNQATEVIRVYDYTLRKTYFQKQTETGDELMHETLILGNWMKTKLDESPFPLESDLVFNNQLANLIRYPSIAQRNGTEGKVIISFIVDEKGNELEYTAVSKLGNGLEEEALRCYKILQRKWEPGKLNNQPVPTKITHAVSFTIR